MSLDHEPKMRWHTLGFVVILCKYGLLLEKLLSMNMRDVVWVMSFDSLIEPDPYVDVDDVVDYDPNWWRGNMDHESVGKFTEISNLWETKNRENTRQKKQSHAQNNIYVVRQFAYVHGVAEISLLLGKNTVQHPAWASAPWTKPQ